MTDFAWHPEHRDPVVLFLTATVIYGVYHYYARAGAWARRWGLEPGDARSVLAGKLAGAVLLGIVPAIVADAAWGLGPAALGLGFDGALLSLGLGAAGLVVLVPIVAAQARTAVHQARYPQVRASLRWDRRLTGRVVGGWVVYLVGYELFFRGFVLLPLVAWLGVWPGLAAMTALYTMSHFDKDAGEALGCIPMGFVFGGLALYTGSLVGPVVLHVGIAVSADLFAVRFSQERRFG